MDVLISINRFLHIAVGFAGLAAWWIPITTTKGGRHHRRLGKVFVVAAYVVGGSALLSPPLRIVDSLLAGMAWRTIVADMGFLLLLWYLGLLTVDLAHYGLRVLRTRREPERLGSPLLSVMTWALMLGSVAVALHAVQFWSQTSVILLVLSPLGIVQGLRQRRYVRVQPALNKPWFYEHMDAMLGAGIAFHTAFLVFGSRVVLDLSVLGDYNWVPWVLPGILGTVGGRWWQRQYRRRFGDLQPGLGSVS